MDTPRDITLTSEELRILAVLEGQAGCDDPNLELSLTTGSRAARLHSRRVVDIAAVLLFVAGVALMLATFAEWPIVGVAGVVVQAIALWVTFSRWTPRVGLGLRRWADIQWTQSDLADRPGRR
jgi:hypothetical protein